MKNEPLVAYFCMEYGLRSDIKLYAGGLGILAGDYLKGAKDLNLPIIGIGLKWKQGYTDQIVINGEPVDTYPIYKYDNMEDLGIKIEVEIRGHKVFAKAWKVENFGNNPIYLLDTDIEDNNGEDRWITGQLYGWFKEERIAQEMILGIGGVKLLRTLGISPDVYHFNEGHAVFAGLELLKEQINNGLSFSKAMEKVKNKIVFTTHTPVIQGNESHNLNILEYMGAFNGLSKKQMIEIGGDPFNMTVAALRLAKISNAVSKLHGVTANKMWKNIKPRSKIISITNGIHIKTWVDERILNSYRTKKDLMKTHKILKKELIDFVYKKKGVKLKENKLLIGFARRAVPYKRSNLIFLKEDLINPLLEKGDIQIIFSGKAHPFDDNGKKIIKDLLEKEKQFQNSVIYLENYDMEIGRYLTRGVDVWLNNPRRPMEASGTSGMKSAMNGVLNLSILDGWWDEACIDGENGWQFGNGFESDDIEAQDKNDLEELYEVLMNKVIPTFYKNSEKWEKMMYKSIETTIDYFNIKRTIEEYYELMYKI